VILGRNPALFVGLVAALLDVLVIVFGLSLTADGLAAINALAAIVIAILANSATPGALPTFSLRTKPDGSSARDLRGLGR
jgi:hypothetical protein